MLFFGIYGLAQGTDRTGEPTLGLGNSGGAGSTAWWVAPLPKNFTYSKAHPCPGTGTGWRVLEPDFGLVESSIIPRWESPTNAPALEVLPFSLEPACMVILTSPSSSFGSWC